jgi:hypothetical protein
MASGVIIWHHRSSSARGGKASGEWQWRNVKWRESVSIAHGMAAASRRQRRVMAKARKHQQSNGGGAGMKAYAKNEIMKAAARQSGAAWRHEEKISIGERKKKIGDMKWRRRENAAAYLKGMALSSHRKRKRKRQWRNGNGGKTKWRCEISWLAYVNVEGNGIENNVKCNIRRNKYRK